MSSKLRFSPEAREQYETLRDSPAQAKVWKAVRKALGFLEVNPRHASLKTHKYETLTRQMGVEVFEAYAQQDIPGAYRIFWCYGPERGDISVVMS
ncbi:MAG: hypothetical protein ACRDJC_18975 [Thermomicrobiales bacterium]